MNNTRPEVQFYEPQDTSFNTQFEQIVSEREVCDDCSSASSWEAVAFLTVGIGLLALALIVAVGKRLRQK